MIINKIKRGELNFEVRENTLDEWVVDEVLAKGCYLKPLEVNERDKVLDIVMNIGAFSVLAAYHGAYVIGFEPCEKNYNQAKKNMQLNDFSYPIYQLGISDETKDIELYLNEKKNRGNHSTTKFRGRRGVTIKCIGINEVLYEYRPTKVKIDCEGEEYKIIMAVDDWYNVEVIRMEWHRRILKDEANIKFLNMIDKLERDGFDVIAKRDGKGWTQMITAKK